jgi:hypothetical protein
MEKFFTNTSLIKLIYKWKITYIIIAVISIALSAVFSGSYFIKPLYKSYAVVYPANLLPYSSETPTEQMLQLLKSEDIIFNIANKFKLGPRYEIDSNDVYYKSKIVNKYNDMVSIHKTEYESVYIEAFDSDPIVAYNIVSEIIHQMDLKARDLQRNKTMEIVKLYKDQLDFKMKQIDSIEKRMTVLRKEYSVLSYDYQIKEITKGMATNGAGARKINNDVEKTLENIKIYGGEYVNLDRYIFSLTNSYNEIKVLYDKSLSDATKELTYANLVTTPVPADKKSYPVRWLIVLISTLSTLVAASIIISLVERGKNK